MKRIISIVLICVLTLSLVGCGNVNKDATKIRFSQSIEELKEYDGKTVTLNGFMSMLSPLDGSLIYLMNIPFQSCPFCLPNTNTLSNTIAVEGKNIEFTSMPVKITGKLVFGDFVDGYGYQYSYRIENAEIVELNENEVSEKTKVYYTVAQDDYIGDLFLVIDCLWQVAYYAEMGIDPMMLSQHGHIPFDRYEEIKSSLESLNANGEYNSFLNMMDEAENLRVKINNHLSNTEIDAFDDYKADADILYGKFDAFISEYEF